VKVPFFQGFAHGLLYGRVTARTAAPKPDVAARAANAAILVAKSALSACSVSVSRALLARMLARYPTARTRLAPHYTARIRMRMA
jgi:hypothetical protein